MERDSEQQSLANFSSTNSGESKKTSPDAHRETPPSGDPDAFLEWLQSRDTLSSDSVIDQLPALIKQACGTGYEAWKAGSCIDYILEHTSGPIECPELVAALDNEHVETMPVVRHLLKIYPRDVSKLDYDLDLDFLDEDDELSLSFARYASAVE